MVSAVESLVVLSWLVIMVFGIAFNVAIGRPSRSLDPTMTRHAVSSTTVTVLEVVALVLASRTLLIAAIIYPVSAAVMVWRFALLIQTRRRAKLRRSGETGRSPEL